MPATAPNTLSKVELEAVEGWIVAGALTDRLAASESRAPAAWCQQHKGGMSYSDHALIWLALAATAAGQSKSSGNAEGSSGSAKASLAEVRSIIHELEGHTEKLRELLSQHGSLVDQRPESEGGSPEAKKAYDTQVAKWSSALERLLVRIEDAHATVVEHAAPGQGDHG